MRTEPDPGPARFEPRRPRAGVARSKTPGIFAHGFSARPPFPKTLYANCARSGHGQGNAEKRQPRRLPRQRAASGPERTSGGASALRRRHARGSRVCGRALRQGAPHVPRRQARRSNAVSGRGDALGFAIRARAPPEGNVFDREAAVQRGNHVLQRGAAHRPRVERRVPFQGRVPAPDRQAPNGRKVLQRGAAHRPRIRRVSPVQGRRPARDRQERRRRKVLQRGAPPKSPLRVGVRRKGRRVVSPRKTPARDKVLRQVPASQPRRRKRPRRQGAVPGADLHVRKGRRMPESSAAHGSRQRRGAHVQGGLPD